MNEKGAQNSQEIFEKHHQGRSLSYQGLLKAQLKQGKKRKPMKQNESQETELLTHENFYRSA